MAFADHKEDVVRMRLRGLTTTQIAEHFGVCGQLVSRYLIDWGYRTRKRDENDLVPVEQPKAMPPQKLKLTPGKRYGDYTFLEMVAARRPLWLFEHRTGWKESFTENQLKEARMA